MTFRDLGMGAGVLTFEGVELLVFWSDWEPTRACWRLSLTGELVLWVNVGQA